MDDVISLRALVRALVSRVVSLEAKLQAVRDEDRAPIEALQRALEQCERAEAGADVAPAAIQAPPLPRRYISAGERLEQMRQERVDG